MNAIKKLYFIACCFPPIGRGNSITNSCVANHLGNDVDVEVVCMEREEGGIISYQSDDSLELALNPSLVVHRLRGANWYSLNIWLYAIGILPCYYLNWAWSVWQSRERIFQEQGALFAVYPVFSDLVIAYALSKRYGFPLLVDFRDDFSGVMARGWRVLLKPWYRLLEKHIVRQAQAITVTTETLREGLLERYDLDSAQVSVVYNVVPSTATENVEQGRCQNDSLLVIYAGAMSQVQRPEVLLKAHAYLCAQDARWADRLRVEFYGPESPYFNLKVRRHLGPGRQFGGFLPQAEISRRVANSDIGFFSLSDDTYAYATPTKLFDYIEAGIPIVASLPNGAARAMIEGHGIGLVAEIGDYEGLAGCLIQMAEDEGLRQRCRARMRAIRAEYRPEIQVEKWRKILADMGVGKAIQARGQRGSCMAMSKL